MIYFNFFKGNFWLGDFPSGLISVGSGLIWAAESLRFLMGEEGEMLSYIGTNILFLYALCALLTELQSLFLISSEAQAMKAVSQALFYIRR